MRPPLKVLINGGGIAGNAVAFWLSRLGHHVTVVERFPSLRVTGLQLDLRGHGIDVIKQMGLEQAIRNKSAPEEGMQVVDSSGKRRAYFPVNKSGKGKQSLTTEFEIVRGDLCRVLYDAALESKVKPEYIFGTGPQSLAQKGEVVEVLFENGQTDEFDLVVGADGQWSRTRRLMHKSETNASSDSIHIIPDLYFAYYTMRRPMENGEQYAATSYMAPGKRGIMTRRHSPGDLQVMLSCRNSSAQMRNARRGSVTEEKAALADIFRNAGWISEDLVKGMMEADDFYCERPGVVKQESWSQGHITLVGDAAYCPTILTGMGTTAAMVGAYILAGEIARHATDNKDAGSLRVALTNYELKFRPYMDQIQDGVVEKATYQYTMPDSPLAISIMNWGLGLASYFNLNIAEIWGIKEVVKGWQLPEYEELPGIS
ncbi:hypothetical protein JX266_011259 [Neoarthrinium moseri]|nr:hypothetical protein JX266_011259 [Neoarthrinium moseri]